MANAKVGEQYRLITITEDGALVPHEITALMDEIAQSKANGSPYTDLFITSHGWMGDVKGAHEQYDKWVNVMDYCDEGKALMVKKRETEQRKFRPLVIGIHWPSKPLADKRIDVEELISQGYELNRDSLVILIASRLANSEPARQAIRDILEFVAGDPKPPVLPKKIVDLFHIIHKEEKVADDGIDGAPGSDREKFDPASLYELARYDKSLVGRSPKGQTYEPEKDSWGPIEKIFGLMSFWQMKNRARTVGENGGHQLLHMLQQETDLSIHLSGHSFGTIVVSSMLQGPKKNAKAIKPVDSLFLIQGAVSHWSFCPNIKAIKKPGYFHSIVRDKKVRGAFVTTRSQWDWAVGKSYPIAAGAARQVDFADPVPEKYGALGYFGACGESDFHTEAMEMTETTRSYGFKPGMIYNIDATNVICKIDGLSGAHCDIARRPVALALWEAAATT